MTTQTSRTIKGYKTIGFSDLHPARMDVISVPLKGAKFLTGWPLIRAHLVDNITTPSPLWLALKNKGFVAPEGTAIAEPIVF